MQNRAKNVLTYIALIVVSTYFLFLGLVKAQAFLAPLAIGILLAMIVLPVARWFESIGLNRVLSSLISTIVILLLFVSLAGVVAWHVDSFVNDWAEIKERTESKVRRLQQFISDQTGITVLKQKEKIEKYVPGMSQGGISTGTTQSGQPLAQQQTQLQGGKTEKQNSSQGSGLSRSMFSTAGNFLVGLATFVTSFILIFTYIFFFLMYRSRFKEALVRFAPDDQRVQANNIIQKSVDTSQQYLFGRLLLVLIQTAFIYIGLVLTGINNAFFISVLAAFLTLIPFIGSIIGYVIALAMGLFSIDATTALIGVSITFGLSQLLENSVLQPYIVGQKVNLNPLITIIIVILGESVWGITGMLIAIPVLGILKVVCDHVPILHPVGYLIGGEEGPNFFDKINRWFSSKFKT